MPQTVTQRPNQNNAWVCTGNPILYKFQRKDYNITAVANSGGALQITVNANLATLAAALGGPVIAGSILWVTTDNGVYNAAYTVVTCTNAANSVITFTAGTYSAAATTGYTNLISNRPAWRLEVELYRQADNTLIFSPLNNSATAAGVTTVNVSILNDYIDQEPFAYLTRSNFNTVHCEPNATTSIGFYIKYRETWTGSAEAQTDDVANPSWAAKGARQIGDPYGGYLKEYSEPAATPTRKFLTKFSRLTHWPGRKSTISYIDSEAATGSRTHIRKQRYNQDGSNWGATYDLPTGNGATTKSIYECLEDVTAAFALRWDKDLGAGTAWSNLTTATPRIVLAAGATSKTFVIPLQLKLGVSYSVNAIFDVLAGAGAEQIRVTVSAITLAGVTRWSQQNTFNQNTSNPIAYTITPAVSDTGLLTVDVTHLGGVNARTMDLTSMQITVPTSGRIDYTIVTLNTAIPMTETVVSETLAADIKDIPDQPVQLFWKNLLAGDSNWVFGFNQELGWRFDKESKRKRMVLYANFLTPAEWEALNELNTIGEVFQPSITELTSAVNKTHVRRGAQVYMVDGNGNKTGVVVIPTEDRTRTVQVQRKLEITIELPEQFAPR